MKLTAKGRYAVMAVADIAAQDTVAAVNLSDISARQNISVTYLEQIFAKLRRAGIVSSVRGPGGGYVLAMAQEAITLDRIIHAVNEDIRAHGCDPATKLSCTGQSAKCLTHNLWGALEGHIEQFLASVSVDDVLNQRFTISDLEAAE